MNRTRYVVALTFSELVVLRRIVGAVLDDGSFAWTKDDLRQVETILCKLDRSPTIHT